MSQSSKYKYCSHFLSLSLNILCINLTYQNLKQDHTNQYPQHNTNQFLNPHLRQHEAPIYHPQPSVYPSPRTTQRRCRHNRSTPERCSQMLLYRWGRLWNRAQLSCSNIWMNITTISPDRLPSSRVFGLDQHHSRKHLGYSFNRLLKPRGTSRDLIWSMDSV